MCIRDSKSEYCVLQVFLKLIVHKQVMEVMYVLKCEDQFSLFVHLHRSSSLGSTQCSVLSMPAALTYRMM